MNSFNAAGLFLDVLPSGVAILTIDQEGTSQNTLRDGLLPAFEAALDQARSTPGVRACVLCSGKEDSFVAGADIAMIDQVASADEATTLSRLGQEAFDRLEAFPLPVVAAIQGACLGGGLELAMACHARVAADTPTTRLGLPEVQLGLLPGAGGTWRLPRLVGIAKALDLMLTGRHLTPRKALHMGLVHEVVPASILRRVAVEHALALADGRHTAPRPRRTLADRALEDNPLGLQVLFTQARQKTLRKTQGNYPAAERILDVVEAGARRGRAEGLQAERRGFGQLALSPESRALRHIFRAMTALKHDNGTDDATVQPRPIHRVGVLGAGLMGAGIASVTLQKAELPVRMRERDHEGLQRGMGHVWQELQRRVRRQSLSSHDAATRFRTLTGSLDWSGFEGIDLVIEAVFEDLELKHRMLRQVEEACGPRTIFATNTSSIPIARIAEAAARPGQVIGMHYFSPVEKMPLLEIIVTPETSPEVIATCVALGQKQGKTVIVVNDGVGFYTSRIVAPYMNEAAFLLSEGVPVEHIDRAAELWGFPVGPITLLDEVGIDVAAKVGPIMVDAHGLRMAPPGTMDTLVARGRLGRKAGKGFYRYNTRSKPAGGRRPVDPTVYDDLGVRPSALPDVVGIGERLGLAMVNEALLCLQEGILRSPRDGDIGAVFGLGFPPFRGGPFRWIDQVGADQVLSRMQRLHERFGLRFAPAGLLHDHARHRRRFYPAD